MLHRLLRKVRRAAGAAPLRVAIVSFDDPSFPCARIRLLDPLANCAERIAVHHALRRAEASWIFDEAVLDDADVVVVQRGVPRADTVELCERVLACGRPVVYEIDDCLPKIPADHGKDHYRENGDFIVRFASRAALVTVSTEPLRQYFERHNARTVVLPNYLNADLWRNDLGGPARAADDTVRLGYVGNPGHRRDLDIVAPALRRLLDDFAQLRLVFLGCAPEGFVAGARCTVMGADFNYATFPRRLAGLGLDLAIAPLIDNAFNRCRSNIKFLEYGFLGIPGVYSDLPAYAGTVTGQTGFLCGESEDGWYAALSALVSSPQLRAAMGRAAREEVRSRWMLAPHAHRWADVYSSVLRAGDARVAAQGVRP